MIKIIIKKIIYSLSEKISLRRKMDIRGKATPISIEDYHMLMKSGRI